jgi:ketosteroid isomerase-like protein
MSAESLETVRQVCAEWEQGNWAGPDLFDPEVEVVFSTTSFPDAGIYHGGRATLDAWRRWLDAWDEFRTEVQDVIPSGERVVVLNRLEGRGKESGIPVEREVGVIFECDRGIIKRMVFCDRREALEVAGLTE